MAHTLADEDKTYETRVPGEPAPRGEASCAIEARALRKVYKASGTQPAKEALKGIDLAVPRGSIFALLGPNGAGKSTFINILAGLVLKTSGSASIWGFDTDVNPRQARASIGVVPQELNIDPFFTPAEVMEMQAGLYGVPKRERRTMEILKAMVHNPPVLILDEPTAGVDIELRRQLWDYVKGLHERGTTIVLTTHYLEEAEALCDTIAIIDKGEVVACEPKETLLARISEKQLIVRPATPATALPAALENMKAELRADGAIEVQYNPAETSAMSILGALSAGGMEIVDISTSESDLEDVFLQLTSRQPEAR